MLYKFKTKNMADVIMLEATGRQILDIVGKDPGPRGILQPPEMAAAVLALEAAIAAAEKRVREAQEAEQTPDSEEIGLRQRAVPFIELLRRCQKDGSDIVWGV